MAGRQYIANLKDIPNIGTIMPIADRSADIQSVFDDANTHGSGLVAGLLAVTGKPCYLPAGIMDMGTTPLYVGSGCKVKGCSNGSTILKYSGTGDAVRSITYGGHGVHNEGVVEDLTIISEAGGCGINNPTYRAGATANSETQGITLRNVVLNCFGTPLTIDNGQLSYWFTCENVLIAGWGGLHSDGIQVAPLATRAMKIGGSALSIGMRLRQVKLSNNARSLINEGTVVSATSTTIRLASGASAVDDFYNGMDVATFNGAGQTKDRRQITDYVGSTRTATVSSWTTQPTSSYTYQVRWIQSISNIYLRGDGSIVDCEFESNINSAPSLEMVDSQLTWIAGHFETHTDQTISRKAMKLDNTKFTTDSTWFAQPWTGQQFVNNSVMTVLGNMHVTDNDGIALAAASWSDVFDVEAGSKIFFRGQDVFANGTSVSALGTATKVRAAYDAAGTLIGYIPIYTSGTVFV